MIDNVAIQTWLERYLTAWTTDAREDIAILFSEDARYFTAPYREPLEGRSVCYRDLWLVTLNAEGRATEFEEYWMREE